MIRALAALVVGLLAACAPRESSGPPQPQHQSGDSLFSATADLRWRLPDRLREISGVALTRDGRVLAHDDEVGVVFDIDVENGGLRKNFALGEPIMLGDFEGAAVVPSGEIYIVESTGRLLRFIEGADGEHVSVEEFDSGLGEICEIEGLAYHRPLNSLILACKTMYRPDMQEIAALYSWSLTRRTRSAAPWRAIPVAALAEAAGVESFHPSSVDIDPRTGRILLLAGPERALAELAPDGAILAARRLERGHVQPEGVLVLPDGALLITDEGARGRALMTRYPRQ